MRITKIKLAGFKSFVDPTTLSLPGNLTGIVGPNGCGKSNIIDAMMWVMGESSAKHLRGDSMADVIFSGSNTRKPVGQASVEIVFDNSDGAIGGQYAGYGEISIRRSITRDGVSVYELNGTRCRRKDITNVFLGTGLGSRGGYSVIEQGMISRVVEAKPEELRGFLEEAAGISKYKERRRETENRIKHTKENLSRLDDIRDELGKQLGHLQRQARAAERYQVLKQEERQWEAQSMAIRWRDIDKSHAEHATDVSNFQTAVEAAVADLRQIETKQTEQREAQTQATDVFNKVQSNFYSCSADISRLENAMQTNEERRGAYERELSRNRGALSDIAAVSKSDEQRLTEISQAIEINEPDLADHDRVEQSATEALQAAESELNQWQQDWEKYSAERAEFAREERAEQVRQEHLNEGISGAEIRIVALEDERSTSRTRELDDIISDLTGKLSTVEKIQDELIVKRDDLRQALQKSRTFAEQSTTDLHGLRTDLQTTMGRQASMRALQDAALGHDQAELKKWLQNSPFSNAPRLAEQVQIERGWELAVEAALRVPLDTLCQAGAMGDTTKVDVKRLPASSVSFIDNTATVSSAEPLAGLAPLTSKVKSDWNMTSALAGIYIAESEAEARALSVRLRAHESVITKSGLWIGPNWIQLPGDADARESVLERERALEDCVADIDRLNKKISEVQQAHDNALSQIKDDEAEIRRLETQISEQQEKVTECKTDLARQETARDQIVERGESILSEVSSLSQKTESDRATLQATTRNLELLSGKLQTLNGQLETLGENRHELQEKLDKVRAEWRDAREAKHKIALSLENLRSTRQSLEDQRRRNTQQHDELVTRCAELEAALAAESNPQEELKTQLEQALQTKLELETAMGAARKTLEEFEANSKSDNEARLLAEQKVEERKQILEQARLEERTIQVRLQELGDRIAQTEFELQTMLQEMPPELDEAGATERLESVRSKITRLGAINLAAIDEFAQLSERKEYLDKQNADLVQALETLEGAIRKIDRETRTRFRETFDKVNSGFQNLFPVLFGGGHAYLELLGEDLLDTGVAVMARPPGKRNSTIHLLSGGEKALTALAFVFSLFELNPAPFCLLDEVDAPLDDANVVRLSDMLKSMSKQVQFMYVSHNKITMEIAEQLIGVTMQEPGVSRLVSVDMEEAVEMAAAG